MCSVNMCKYDNSSGTRIKKEKEKRNRKVLGNLDAKQIGVLKKVLGNRDTKWIGVLILVS